MIVRVWRGWTKPEDADAYETLLREEIFPGIAAKGVEGYSGDGRKQLWRCSGEVAYSGDGPIRRAADPHRA